MLLHAEMPEECSSALDPEGRPIHQPNCKRSPPLPPGSPLPVPFHRAVEVARVLSREVDFARFAFQAASDDLHAGEIRLFPGSGMQELRDPALSPVLCAWDLRNPWFLRQGATAGEWLARRNAEAPSRALAAERAAKGWA